MCDRIKPMEQFSIFLLCKSLHVKIRMLSFYFYDPLHLCILKA